MSLSAEMLTNSPLNFLPVVDLFMFVLPLLIETRTELLVADGVRDVVVE